MTNHYYTGQVLDETEHEAAIAAIVDTGATVHVRADHKGTGGRTRFVCTANMGTVYTYWYHEYTAERLGVSWPQYHTLANGREYRDMVQSSIERGLVVAIQKVDRGHDPSAATHRYTVYSGDGAYRELWRSYRVVKPEKKAGGSIDRSEPCVTPPLYAGQVLDQREHDAAIAATTAAGSTVHVSADPRKKQGEPWIVCRAVVGDRHTFWYHNYAPASPERWPDRCNLVGYEGSRAVVQRAVERGYSVLVSQAPPRGAATHVTYIYSVHGLDGRTVELHRRAVWPETEAGSGLPLVPCWDC